MRETPIIVGMFIFSDKNRAAKITAKTILSLSIDATCATLPDCNAEN